MKVDFGVVACCLVRQRILHYLKAREECQLFTERSGLLLWAKRIDRDLGIQDIHVYLPVGLHPMLQGPIRVQPHHYRLA